MRDKLYMWKNKKETSLCNNCLKFKKPKLAIFYADGKQRWYCEECLGKGVEIV